jgi:hypothetical protein
MSQFTIESGTFDKPITNCGKFSAHLLLPASFQKKRCRVQLKVFNKKGKVVLDLDNAQTIPAVCGTSCHIKMSKSFVGMTAKGLITLHHKEN